MSSNYGLIEGIRGVYYALDLSIPIDESGLLALPKPEYVHFLVFPNRYTAQYPCDKVLALPRQGVDFFEKNWKE